MLETYIMIALFAAMVGVVALGVFLAGRMK